MTRATKLLATTAALALGGAVVAGASLAGAGWDRSHGGHHGGFGGDHLFESFDVNDDGILTQTEIEEVRQSRLTEFDANGDGSLSLEEYQALWMEAMRERMVDRFQAHDDDGDGQVTVEEFGEPFNRIISRLDDDGDGQVTQEEIRSRGRDRDRGDHRD